MKLKTYVGRDPQEALAQVKKDLGPEAVILSTQSRRYPRSPSRSPQLRQVEVTAAVNQSSPWTPSRTSNFGPRVLSIPGGLPRTSKKNWKK